MFVTSVTNTLTNVIESTPASSGSSQARLRPSRSVLRRGQIDPPRFPLRPDTLALKRAPSAADRGHRPAPAGEFTPETSLLFGLVRFMNYVGQEFEQKFAPSLDISVAEWRVMIVIGSHPEISAVEVANATGYSEMHVSRIVRHLVAKGDVSRAASRTDRRRAELALTRKGQRIYEIMLSNTREAEARVIQPLSAGDITHLRAIVQTLNEQFGPFGRDSR